MAGSVGQRWAGVALMADVVDRDLGWRRLVRDMGTASKQPYTKVGILSEHGAGETHPDEDGKSKISMVGLAAVHEFGTRTVPARSFIGDTIDIKRREIDAFREKLVGKVYDGKLSPTRALGLLGEKAVLLMKRRIKEGIDPPLHPLTIVKKTIAGKRGTTPLIDTGRMWNAIAQEVVAR
jgi:hypothetical protein